MLIFLYRFFINLIIFLYTLPLILIGIVVLPCVLPFWYKSRLYAGQGSVRSWKLPVCLRWFDIADLYTEFNRNPITYLSQVTPDGWFAIYKYIAFRNPLNYFSYKYLSFTWGILDSPPETGNIEITLQSGSIHVGNGLGQVNGLYHVEIRQGSRTYYEYYYVKRYSSKYCFRFRMGYKIGNPLENKTGDIEQQVFVINPFCSYS